MKKITNFIKGNVKVLVGITVAAIVSGGSVYAATILMNANQVGFDNTNTTLSSTDVQGALDELYTRSSTWIAPMQGFDKSSLANVGDSVRLYDTRDGNTYVVKKLADGKVWMTENLRLINKTISSADSNLPSGETWTVPASSTSGFNSHNTNNAYLDSTYGGYYTFYTATAGTGGTSLTSGNAPSDICPKGWRLPTGSPSGEFKTLYNNYASSALMRDAPGFVLSGNVDNGSVYSQGSNGAYWSSTADGANSACRLYLNSSSANPASTNAKFMGFSVRCVAS